MRLSAYRGRRRRGWPPWTTLRRIRRGHSSPPRELGRRRWEAPQKIGSRGTIPSVPALSPVAHPQTSEPRVASCALRIRPRGKAGGGGGVLLPWTRILLGKSPVRLGSGSGFEDDAIALRLQGVNGAAPGPGGLALRVVGWPELAVGRAIVEHMIGNDEHGMGHGEDGLLVAPAPHHATIAGGERRVGARGGPRRFEQRRPQPAIALARLARAAFPGTFMLAWTQARPARQVARRREHRHVPARLREKHFGGAPTHSRNAVQGHHRLRERAQRLVD